MQGTSIISPARDDFENHTKPLLVRTLEQESGILSTKIETGLGLLPPEARGSRAPGPLTYELNVVDS